MTVCDLYRIVKDFQIVNIINSDIPTDILYAGTFENVPDEFLSFNIGHIEFDTCKCCGTLYIKIYV